MIKKVKINMAQEGFFIFNCKLLVDSWMAVN